MQSSTRRKTGILALAAVLAGPLPVIGVTAPPPDDATVVHVLNRLAYGPGPGDVERVRALGLSKWIDGQLQPERIDDAALRPRLAGLETLALSSGALMKGYDLPREAKREIQKKQAEMGDASEAERRTARREFMQKYGAQMDGPPRRVIEELQEGKVLRAVYSERQLEEVMTDFWLNHFNVYAQKGPVKYFVAEYERDVLRPHAFGRFEDLLLATAQSPAMLFYLDNWLSTDPSGAGGMGRGRSARRPMGGTESAPNRRRGLNENYAREIMELHTLGVDGGYTQKDVTEVARCFTGWTIRGLRQQDPEFHFDARFHDNGTKVVVGQAIKAGGQDEGRKVIHLLATHPSTARLIATKLTRRFVADDPPPGLVDRAAAVFRKTDGDIREVVRSIVTSAEFLAPEARTAKIKTPLEFVVSAVRASGVQVGDARALAKRIADMGMPLYMQQPPTGYKDAAEAWVSTSALLARLNFATDLAAGRVPGVALDASRLLADRLVPQGLGEQTRKTLSAEGDLTPSRMAGLVLGSPEFQRR